MYIDAGWLWGAAAVCTVVLMSLLRLLVKLRHQVACLRFCYMDMSDWAERRLAESREFAIDKADGDEGELWLGLKNYKEDWGERVDMHTSLMKREGLAPLSGEDRVYAIHAASRFAR